MSKFEGTILVKDVSKAIKKIAAKHEILNTDLRIVAREFLKYFIDVDFDNDAFKTIRDSYIKRFEIEEDNDIPKDETEFYQKVCEENIGLIPNNTSNLKQLTLEITDDLRQIEIDRDRYQKQLDDLKKGEFEEGDNYKMNLLIHYIKKQNEAEREILDFIKNKLRIKATLNRYKTFDFVSKLIPEYTYAYHIWPQKYQLEHLSEISNKLRDIKYIKYIELEKLYRTNKPNFLKELKALVNPKEVIEQIKSIANNNFELNKRKVLIDDILQLFENSKLELFCNVVPQQIEGIIYSYCLLFGMEDKSLQNTSLVEKLNLLKEAGNKEISYEYFAFIFPLIRNHVAHGKLIASDLELNSWLLLLDLQYSCQLLQSHELNINKELYQIKSTKENPELLELIQLAPVLRKGIDPFYKNATNDLSELKEVLRSKLLESQFPYQLINDENRTSFEKNLRIIKDIGINDQECGRIIKKLSC